MKGLFDTRVNRTPSMLKRIKDALKRLDDFSEEHGGRAPLTRSRRLREGHITDRDKADAINRGIPESERGGAVNEAYLRNIRRERRRNEE